MTAVAADATRPMGRANVSAGVQSIARALAILDALAENDGGLSLTVLSRGVGLPPSSAHRLLTTLQRSQFVRFEQASMTWRVGVQAFVVGAAFARSRDVTPIAMPYMRQLMEKTGETVNLYVPNNAQAICIAQVQSQQMISAISRPGGGLPLDRSAAGKAFLAALPKDEVEKTLAKLALGAEGRSSGRDSQAQCRTRAHPLPRLRLRRRGRRSRSPVHRILYSRRKRHSARRRVDRRADNSSDGQAPSSVDRTRCGDRRGGDQVLRRKGRGSIAAPRAQSSGRERAAGFPTSVRRLRPAGRWRPPRNALSRPSSRATKSIRESRRTFPDRLRRPRGNSGLSGCDNGCR